MTVNSVVTEPDGDQVFANTSAVGINGRGVKRSGKINSGTAPNTSSAGEDVSNQPEKTTK